jgi:DNA-binding NtrC family response regulator
VSALDLAPFSAGIKTRQHASAKFAILLAMVAAETPVVFVVDDDPSVRKSLTRLLKAAGWEVESFASGREFLAQPRPDRPSCLLLDVRMPGLTGPDLQDASRGWGSGCPSCSSPATATFGWACGP